MDTLENPTPSAAAVVPASAVSAPRPHPGVSSALATTPADIWRIIRKRLVLIIVVAVIVSVAGIIFTLAWWTWWPSWAAEAMLEVRFPVIPEVLAPRQATPKGLIEIFQRSEANAIKSRQYAVEILKDEEIRNTQWYKKSPADAQFRFEKELSVAPIRTSSIIVVRFETRDPDEAPRIVNKLINIYLQDRKERATTDLRNQLAPLRRQYEALSLELNRVVDGITAYVQYENIPVIRMMYTDVEAKLSRLSLDQTALQLANDAATAARDNMQLQDPYTWVPGAEQDFRIENDPEIRTLRAYLLQLEQEREARSKRLGPDHLHLKRMDELIRIVDRDLQTKLAEVRLQVFNQTLQEQEAAVLGYGRTLEQIEERIAEALDTQRGLNPKILEYRLREERKIALEKFIGEIDDRIKSIEATIAAQGELSSQVVLQVPALPSPEPTSPRLLLNIVASIFLGLFVGLGLAFALEYLDTSLRSSLDIRRHTRLAFLGSIPALQEDEANPQDMYSVVTQAPRSLLAEAFRQVRTNILFYCTRGKCRSMLVTSPSPDDGRTCVAVNLAASVALSGHKVLLIDANFCKPTLDRLFADLPTTGFADLLLAKASMEQVIIASDVPGLSIMGSGHIPTDHTEVLGRTAMRDVIGKAAAQFDQVILDGPPALVTSHALALAANVDGVLFVARAGKNTRGEINRMREEISRLNSHIHGVILNGVQATSGGYLRKSYQRFYDYQLSSQATAAIGEQQIPQPPEQS